MQENTKIAFSQREIKVFIAVIILFSALFRLTAAVGYYSTFDTFWYKGWALDISNGLFDIYKRAEKISLDYPPLYLFCLALTGMGFNFFGAECDPFTQMFLLKFWPVFFDCVMIYVLWRICSKFSPKAGIAAALFWALNPSVIFNTSFWGQTDQLMCLLLVVSFYLASQKRPVLACFAFAVAGLTKFQCLYFTPVLLLIVFYESGFKNLLKGVGAAALTVAAVFLPFMIGSGNINLFYDVYTGGADTYPYCTLNAFNLYGCFRLNWKPETTALFGPFTFASLSSILTFISFAGTIIAIILAKRKCGFVGGLLIMQCVFMLTVRQHERYQIVVLPFALMAYVIHNDKRFLHIFSALSVMTLSNQALLLFDINSENCLWAAPHYNTVMQVFSIINSALFVWTVYVCLDFMFKKGEIKNDLLN